MLAHKRAMIAAAAYAYIRRQKVAGLHDHSTGLDLDIAAESRADQVQGFDGDRSAAFGGTLPELFDAGDQSFTSFVAEGNRVTGYERYSATHYVAEVSDARVQFYDYDSSAWTTFDVQIAA